MAWCILLAHLTALGSMVRAQPEPEPGPPTVTPLTDGARWCFVGDGLTQRGGFLLWLSAFAATRHPERDVEIVNRGVAGDTPAEALLRISWDVAPVRPTHLAVLWGTTPEHETLVAPEGGDAPWTSWLAQARALDAQLWWVEAGDRASAPGVSTEGSLPDGATNLNVTRVALGDVFAGARAAGLESGAIAQAPDVVDVLIAWALLRAAGADAEVAGLTVDLRSGRFVASNSTAERMLRTESDLSFVWTAHALPFPLPEDRLPRPLWKQVMGELSRESLQVLGLPAGRWRLSIDGVVAGEYSNEQLETGIDLGSGVDTPQRRQARDVLRLLQAREKLIAENIRTVAQVEHRLAPDQARPVDAQALGTLITAKLPEVADESLREAMTLYAQRKPRVGAAASAAGRLLTQARRAAQPQSHVYLLRAVR